jgi:peptidoglycan/LPS O-acetylase OafA/YrhL
MLQAVFPAARATPAPATARRYEALDSLRGLAACWVFIFHVPSTGHSWPLMIVQNGFLAVTFFFILSGFVIGASYGERLTAGYPLGKFMLLRWGRVYPLHAFIIAVMIAYEIIRGLLGIEAFREGAPFTGLTALPDLVLNIFMLQGATLEHTWNKPSWSISVELWTYLAAALLLASLRVKRLMPTGIILMIPGAFMALFGRRFGIEISHGLDQLLGCFLGFGIGLCIYEMRQLGIHLPDEPRHRTVATIIEAISIAFVLAMSWMFGGKLSLMVYPAFALMVWVFSSQAGYFSQLLLKPAMLLLGTLSYSLYMVHHFVQDRFLDAIRDGLIPLPLTVPDEGRLVLVGNPWLCDAVLIAMLAVSLPVAYFTYHFIEDPARKWSRKLADRLSARTQTA